MLRDDPLAHILYVDLSERRYWIERRPELFDTYLGGAGVATKLLQEECPKDCDPFAPENPIIFAVGPLTGLFPLASKTVAMFKSPHTGNLGESHCGGRSAVAIRMAGYGAIVIRGASDMPIYLAIHEGAVHFRDASVLWGMRSSFTVGRIIRENEPGAGLRTIMRIGRAGEQLVSYACVTTETYRHFGRLGLGALFGSKKLKGIAISGKRSLPVRDRKTYQRLYRDIHNAAVSSSAMKKYHDLGTAQNVLPLNQLGALPTRNLTAAQFDGASHISGETLAEHFLGRRLACSHCPVACIHVAALREPYEDEPYFYKTSMISYDYEPIYALATMLGVSDNRGFLRLMDEIEAVGVDAMSTGVVLAWATEAQEKGLLSEEDTMGVRLSWGDYRAYIDAVRSIVSQPNDFYAALARGVECAATQYGGQDFALAFGKNEMPGYHTGPAAHVGVLIGARHSHLDNAGYSIDQKAAATHLPGPDELVDALLTEERWRQILSSLVLCFFARGIYGPETVVEALRSAGFEFSQDDLSRLGETIHREKYRFKVREGFSFDDLRIPRRILETPSALGQLDEEFLRDVVNRARKALLIEDVRDEA